MSDVLRDLATLVTGPDQLEGPVRMRRATVDSVQGSSVTLRMAGSSVLIPGVKCLEGIAPLAGDTVQVLQNGPDLLCLGPTGVPTTAPIIGAWTAYTPTMFWSFAMSSINSGGGDTVGEYRRDASGWVVGHHVLDEGDNGPGFGGSHLIWSAYPDGLTPALNRVGMVVGQYTLVDSAGGRIAYGTMEQSTTSGYAYTSQNHGTSFRWHWHITWDYRAAAP